MPKKFFLSCTAIVAVVLSGIHLNAQAKNLEISESKKEVSNETYEIIHAKKGSQIIGKHLTIIGNKKTNTNISTNTHAITAEGSNTTIELLDGTTIKGTGSSIFFGLVAKDGATLKMTGGTITVSNTGAKFLNSKNAENKLKDIIISSGKGKAPLNFAIVADKDSEITLENLKVSKAMNSVVANNQSKVTISGGSFDAKGASIHALSSSTITLTNNAQITSSDNVGLYAEGSKAKITMTGGNITGKDAALSATKGGHIQVTDVSLKIINSPTFTVNAYNSDTIIELLGNTTISGDGGGLFAKDNAMIKMTGGSINASYIGASFNNSKNAGNKLKDIIISSGKGKSPLSGGVFAYNGSQVTLENVKVTKAMNSVTANNKSEITVLGGSFDATKAAISAYNGSRVTLTNNVQATSSHGTGLHATDSETTIEMTGGSVITEKMTLVAENGGHIKVTDVALTATNDKIGTVVAGGPNSMIELHGNTTIKNAVVGLHAQNSGMIKMIGGTITASKTGAGFYNSKSDENKLENVKISSSNDKEPKITGIGADKESKVTLENVTVTQAKSGIAANNHSKVTVSGGSFEGKTVGVYAGNGSNITLTSSKKGNVQVTSSSSNSKGLYTNGLHSTITMTGGTVTGELALNAENGGHIKVTDVSLTTTNGNGGGAGVDSANSMIELYGNTTIKNATVGLLASNDGVIKMIGGTITASATGVGFVNSKSTENKLENVIISTGKDKNSGNGIRLEKESRLTLKNVKVTQTGNSVIANNRSNITISGGSFDSSYATICAQNGSSITLTDNAQITSYDEAGLYAQDSKSTIIMTTGSVTGKYTALEADIGGHITVTNVALKATNNGSGVAAGAASSGSNSVIELLGNTTISDVKIGIDAQNDSTIKMIGGTITASESGVHLLKNKSNNKLKDVTILNSKDNTLLINAIIARRSAITLENVTVPQAINSIISDNGSQITVSGGSFNAEGAAISAINGSTITLTDNTQITSSDDAGLYAKDSKSVVTVTGGTVQGKTTALSAQNGGRIKATNVTLITADSNGSGAESQDVSSLVELYGHTTIKNAEIGLSSENGGMIKMIGGTVIAENSAFVVNNNGHIDVTDVSVTAEDRGIAFEKSKNNKTSEVNLTNTKLHIKNGTGINANESIGKVNLKNSEIRANVLLVTEASTKKNDFTFTLNADHSVLDGKVSTEKKFKTIFDLQNNTKWTLKTSTNKKSQNEQLLDIAQRVRSDISVLNINDSSIVFEEPTEDHYHTLHIGSGRPNTKKVYNATGKAEIHFNVEWSDSAAVNKQKADHLLIHGDVSGTTLIYITGHLEKNNIKADTSALTSVRGLSLIQVSGKANQNSFKLANGYITISGSPYKYILKAYGPKSNHSKTNTEQNLLGENKNFWDFRLQPVLLDSDSKVKNIVP
ncbi:right-handed parallel beta-helix repeat-containing protein [Bartonella grahamii]|uniref:right-handed parallel beta-helix repeat-containing protein n=1 Tax=Bartonella grahamii TaxID=33045 RepID=UPI00236276D1|nr:right-handed parallel beta-helix repeat-containing protein [Bartonella grahamii]